MSHIVKFKILKWPWMDKTKIKVVAFKEINNFVVQTLLIFELI